MILPSGRGDRAVTHGNLLGYAPWLLSVHGEQTMSTHAIARTRIVNLGAIPVPSAPRIAALSTAPPAQQPDVPRVRALAKGIDWGERASIQEDQRLAVATVP